MRSSIALLLFAIACGPMAGHETTPTGGGSGSGSGSGSGAKAPGPGDVSMDLTAIEVKGVLFEPQAIYAPAMMLYYPKRKTTLDAQRAKFASTKDAVQKEAQAAVLATMLYDKSKTEKDDAAKQKLWLEALQALRDSAENAGEGKSDDITLRLIGRYSLLLNDYPTAEKAWAELVTRFPKEKDADENRAWWGYSLLEQYKNADALAAVQGATISEKVPELAYVAAWAKFRAGDDAGAWGAIVTAAKGWGDRPEREALERDLYLFAGRTNTSFADAMNALSPIVAKSPVEQADLAAKLGVEAYQFAGRWADGIPAIDKAIALSGAKLDPEGLVKLRYTQADYALRVDDPAAVASYSKQALDTLATCGAKCAPEADKLVQACAGFARLLFAEYATAHDDRYYQPAKDLYQAVLAHVGTDKQLEDQVLKDTTSMDGFKKEFAAKPNVGTHAQVVVEPLINLQNQQIQACYERALVTNPKIAGSLVLQLESDQTGAIKGASTQPAGGMADLPAVATCVLERARAWHLPKIANGTGTHSTRIKVTYSLAVRPHDTAGTPPAKPETPPAKPGTPPAKK